MKTLALLLPALCGLIFAEVAPLPGSDYLGYSFDATVTDAFGGAEPLRPVLMQSFCDDACFTEAHMWEPECSDCSFWVGDIMYKVPREMQAMSILQAGGCVEAYVCNIVDDYQRLNYKESHHSSWFGLHSKTKISYKFYEEYYENDRSMSLMYKFLMLYSLSLPPPDLIPLPLTPEFNITLMMLPLEFNANDPNDPYTELISNYGTHVMDTANLGGMILSTLYFHSCFLEQMTVEWVIKESGWSFFDIINYDKAKGQGTNKTDATFDQFSQDETTVRGGFPERFPLPSRGQPWNSTNLGEWMESVKDDPVPVKYSMRPLTDYVSHPTKKANLQQALEAYGASVDASNKQLVDKLVPKDPYVKPAWCDYNPHPSFSGGKTSTTSQAQVIDDTFPDCPRLPTE